MANTIIVKRSSVAGKVPVAGDLQIGELAVNLTDRKIFSKDSGGTVVQLGGGTYAAATSTALGLIELGSDTVQSTAANAVTSTASRTYALQVNAAGQGVVNVPWTDTNSGGTVTSVTGSGTVSGLSLSGTVTASGSLTLGGTLAVTPGNFATQTAATVLAGPTTGVAATPSFRSLVASDIPALSYVTSVTGTAPVTSSGGLTPAIGLASGYGDTQNPFASKTANFVLAAPNGAAGAPSFRALVAADIPTLNQNTTGTASNVTGTVAIANGGTGANSTSAARTNLGAFGGVSTDLNTDSSDFAWTHTNLPDTSTDFNSLQTTNAYSRLGSLFGSTNGPFGNQWYSIANMQHRGGAGPDGSLWGSVLAIGLTANQTRAAFRTKSSPSGVTTYSAWREIITTTTGTGTSNTIPKFTGAGAITNGSITDDGTTVKATAGRLVFATGGTDRGTIRTTTNEIAIESQGVIHFNYYGGGFGGTQSGRAPVYFWKGSNYGSATIPTEAFTIEAVAGQSRCHGNFLANTFQSVGAWDATTGSAQIYLNGATGNRIDFNTAGQGFPTFTTRSAGTKIVLHPNIGATLTDYAIGFVATDPDYGIWQSVPSSGANFYWRAGISNVATLSGAGSFSCGSVVAGGAQLSRIWAGFPLNGTGTARINVNSFGSNFIDFHYLGSSTASGQIYYNTATAATIYATTSDYRLKTDIQPVEGAAERVLALKPKKYRMIGAEEPMDGFLAHELAEVAPYAVGGEKDDVKEDGSISPQIVDLSKLVPLLTSALQDALHRITTLEEKIAELTNEKM